MADFVLRLFLFILCIQTIREISAQDDGFGGRSYTDFFPDNAAYDSFVLDPYHIHGAPFGGFSRSAQSKLASLPLHLPEILEYERATETKNNALYFDARDDNGRLFVCRLYHEDELAAESLHDSMFTAPILRGKVFESDVTASVEQTNTDLPVYTLNEAAVSSTESTLPHDTTTKDTTETQILTKQLDSSQTAIEGDKSDASVTAVKKSVPLEEEKTGISTIAQTNVLDDTTKSPQNIENKMLEIEIRLQELHSICGQIHKGWWSYEWCFEEAITQFHIDYNAETNTIQVENILDLGHYNRRIILLDMKNLPTNEFAENTPEIARVTDVYTDGSVCDETGESRVTNVNMVCCSENIAQQHKGMLHKQGHPVTSNIAVFVDIQEDDDILCLYNVTVCTPLLCDTSDINDGAGSSDVSGKSEYRVLSRSTPTDKELAMAKENESIREILDRVLNMLCLQTNHGGWWTYEICYKQSIRQFHETIGTKRNSAGAKIVAKITETEHTLGVYDETKERRHIPDAEEWKLVVNATVSRTGSNSVGSVWGEGSGAYYEIEYTGGEVCDDADVTDSAIVAGSAVGANGDVERSSTVRFFCGELYDVAVHEDSTCHYIVQVKVPALCQHRLFRAPSAKKQVIKCLPADVE